jgi:hypothetical protein
MSLIEDMEGWKIENFATFNSTIRIKVVGILTR